MNISHRTISLIAVILLMTSHFGCASDSKRVRKLTKPIDDTAENIVKIREFKSSSGETRAVVSPADEKQLRIPF